MTARPKTCGTELGSEMMVRRADPSKLHDWMTSTERALGQTIDSVTIFLKSEPSVAADAMKALELQSEAKRRPTPEWTTKARGSLKTFL
ncbi:hypothetical protein QR680_007681 [Steinernema hermaphroditum]|uniref:Uncharacterized protein n=1 Tax=Steinernema hermaphroditum TaxID=289476 RepID=A0AA39IFC6_9BILA|nr:hypothetical protein QR680_007681 [Steinernema hermaphroditum]